MKKHVITFEFMKEWLITNILDDENLTWMSHQEIINTFNKYYTQEN